MSMKMIFNVITAVSATTFEPAIDIATVSASPCVAVIKDMGCDSVF